MLLLTYLTHFSCELPCHGVVEHLVFQRTRGHHLISDTRNLADGLHTEVLPLKGSTHRIATVQALVDGGSVELCRERNVVRLLPFLLGDVRLQVHLTHVGRQYRTLAEGNLLLVNLLKDHL